MAVVLRLKRFGKRGKPTYRIVAIDKREKRQGREIEVVGSYDPNFDPPKVVLKHKQIDAWLKQGAQLSTTVRNLLRKNLWKNS